MAASKKDPAFRSKSKASSSSFVLSVSHSCRSYASSREAASLLSGGGFVGFDSVYGSPEAPQHTLSPEYQLAFKKLTKKDTITKLKGLHELEALFPSLDDTTKTAVLERWVQAFNVTGLDNDRQVREGLHRAFSVLVEKVKKDLAVHLKSIITVWLLNQHDSYREVRTAAQSSFRAAISRKQAEALLFCKQELVTQLGEYLAHTPQTLSDVKAVGEAEANERWERVISASLLTIDFIFEQVSAADLVKFEPGLSSLVNANVWKLLSSRSPLIRRGAYQLVSSVTSKAQPLIAPHVKTLAPVLLGAFGDKEAVTHTSLWQGLLTFLKAFPAAWDEVNVRKAVWPRLFAFLSAGCHGSAASSYPSLLPLLQLIPLSVLGSNPSEFYTQLLNNIWAALSSDGTLTQADAAPALKAMSEVTLFASITLAKGGSVDEAATILTTAYANILVSWLSTPQPRVPIAAFLSSVSEVCVKLRSKGEPFSGLLSGLWNALTAQFEKTDQKQLLGDEGTRWSDLLNSLLALPSPTAPASPAPLAIEAASSRLPVVTVQSPFPSLVSFVSAIATRSIALAKNSTSTIPLLLLSRIATSVGLSAVSPTFFDDQLLPLIRELLQKSPSSDIENALRSLLSAHLSSLSPDASTTAFASLLAALAALAPSAQMTFVAPLLQDVQIASSAALDALCLSAVKLTTDSVSSLAAVVQRGSLSPSAVSQLAAKINTVAANESDALTLAGALVARLDAEQAGELLRNLLPLRLSTNQATASKANALYSPVLLARLPPTSIASLGAAAEALLPAHLLESSALSLADFVVSIVEMRGLAIEQPAAQELLVRLVGSAVEWTQVAQQAARLAKGVDYIQMAASPPPVSTSSSSLSFAQCARRVHLALLLLQRGLVNQLASAPAMLSAVAVMSALTRHVETCHANEWDTLQAALLTDEALVRLATSAQWSAALGVVVDCAATNGGVFVAAAPLVAKLAQSSVSTLRSDQWALESQAATEVTAALIRCGGLANEAVNAVAKTALRVVLSAAPEKPLDVASVQRGAQLLAAVYAVQGEEDMRLLSLVTLHQSLAAKSTLPSVEAEPRLHASWAALHTSIVGRLSNSALLQSQLEFLIARVVEYLRHTDASEASLLLRFQGLHLQAALTTYASRWTLQPLPPAVALQRDAAAALVKQVAALAGSPVQGSARSLAAALERAVMQDRLLGVDIETPEALYDALLVAHLPLQRASYVLLNRASTKQAETLVARAKSAAASAQKEDEAESEKLAVEKHVDTVLPEALKRALQSDGVLSLLGAADEQTAAPVAVGFALCWSALLDLLQNSQLRSKVTPYLRETRLGARYCSFLFAFIDLSQAASAKLLQRTSLEVLAAIEPNLESLSECCSLLLLRMVRTLPAVVRSWWTDDCDRSSAQQIEKYCIKNICPLLIDAEVQQVLEAKKEENCVIKASRSVQEVSAAYEKDELIIEITVKIPPSYPLRCVEVDSPRRKGMTEALWRKWLLSMTTLLLTQDGSILDAILLWKRSLDAHFDGVECCPICYAVFHASNYSLPRLTCKTCKNKFHHACMHKWFSTSHKSTCPLCQTPFSFDKNL